jgi:hypothetical protein
MRRMGMQCKMRRIYYPMKSDRRFALNWMQRIQDKFPCSAWEPGKGKNFWPLARLFFPSAFQLLRKQKRPSAFSLDFPIALLIKS